MRLMPSRHLSPAAILVTAFLLMVAELRPGAADRCRRERRTDHRARHRAAVQAQPAVAHKVPARQEFLDELITEILKVKEAKQWGLEVTDSEVDAAFGTMATRMRLTPDQLTQVLAKAGVYAATLKQRIRADMAWPSWCAGGFKRASK